MEAFAVQDVLVVVALAFAWMFGFRSGQAG